MDLCLLTCEPACVLNGGINQHISSFSITSVSHEKASEDDPEDGGQASASLRAQLEGTSLLLKKLVLILLTGLALKCLPPHVFREQEEGEPAARGENTGSAEASSVEAALPGEVHKNNTSADGLLWW